MQPYVAQVMIFSFNYAPRNWAFCNGALFPINQNQALFSLIGTYYGGDGIRTFALPNIQDRAVMSAGQGQSLSNYALGATPGVANVALTQGQIPLHTHTVSGDVPSQGGAFELLPKQGDWIGNRAGALPADSLLAPAATPGRAFNPQTISTVGGSAPHTNQQPYLAMNFCIALYGIFPSRN